MFNVHFKDEFSGENDSDLFASLAKSQFMACAQNRTFHIFDYSIYFLYRRAMRSARFVSMIQRIVHSQIYFTILAERQDYPTLKLPLRAHYYHPRRTAPLAQRLASPSR